MDDGVFEVDVLGWVLNHLEVVVKCMICFSEDVQNQALHTLRHAVIVAITIQVVAAVEKFFYLKFMLLRVADEPIDDSSALHDDLGVEAAVGYVELLRVSKHVVDFVDIDTITRVRHNFI